MDSAILAMYIIDFDMIIMYYTTVYWGVFQLGLDLLCHAVTVSPCPVMSLTGRISLLDEEVDVKYIKSGLKLLFVCTYQLSGWICTLPCQSGRYQFWSQ